jgi:hypothetical protein
MSTGVCRPRLPGSTMRLPVLPIDTDVSKRRQRCKPQQQDRTVTTGRTWPDVVAEAMQSNLTTARLCVCLLCIGGLGGLGIEGLVSCLQRW